MSLSNSTVAVTGCSAGIGAACCVRLKECGARIVGLDIEAPSGVDVDTFVRYDQGDVASVREAVAHVPDELDGLLNVAGVPPSDRFQAADVLRINFFGLRELTSALLPKLRRGAAIVNMSSGTGAGWPANLDRVRPLLAIEDFADIPRAVDRYDIVNSGTGGDAAYPLSKQLLSVWTMQLSAELKDRRIRVNAVAPAAVDTRIIGDFLASFGKEAADRTQAFGAATPQSVADASVFLLTSDARWINGAILPVDGGAVAAGTVAKLGLR